MKTPLSALCGLATLLIAIVSLPSAVSAAPDIDVLVVYSKDQPSSFNVVRKSLSWKQHTIVGLSQSDISDRKFTFWPSPVEADIVAGDHSFEELRDWLREQNSNLSSPIRAQRDLFSADVVLMAIPEAEDSVVIIDGKKVRVCGYGPDEHRAPGFKGQFSEERAFGIVQTGGEFCERDEEVTVMHELGHILFAEHQFEITDDEPEFPVSYNHGHTQNATEGWGTIMYIPVGENTLFTFSNPDTFGNTETADVHRLVTEDNGPWPVVAAYRNPPPPTPAPNINICFVRSNTCTDHDVVVVPENDSGPISSLHVWYDWLYSPAVDFQFFGTFPGLTFNWFQKGNVEFKIHAHGPGGEDICVITLPIPVFVGDEYCGFTP